MPRYASIFHFVLFCFLGLLSSSVLALGLGEITLKSHLNQPLVAEIELLQVRELTLSEILPGLASRKDFDAAGVERGFLLGLMSFEVKLGEKGRNIILVTTTKPIREPFLNFLVEVIWPSGRLLREYTLLLDPPVFADAVPAANAPAKKTITQKTTQSSVRRESSSRSAVATQPPASVANRAPLSSISTSSTAGRQSASNQKSVARPSNQIDRSTAANATGNDQYRINRGDNLMSIAKQMRDEPSADLNQVMVAIQRENPSAFIDDNINLLKQGAVIRKPSSEAIASMTKRAAVQEVARQSKLWKTRLNASRKNSGALDSRVLDATGEDTMPDAPTKKDQDGGRISLVSGEGRKDKSGSGGTAARGGDSALIAEELDKAKISNQDLTERLTSLSQQLDDSKKLIDLKSQQFAELKARLAEIEAENARLKSGSNASADNVTTDMAETTLAPSEATPAPMSPVDVNTAMPETAASDEMNVPPSASAPEMSAAEPTISPEMPADVAAIPADALPADALPADAQPSDVQPTDLSNPPEDLNFNPDGESMSQGEATEAPVTEPTQAPAGEPTRAIASSALIQELLTKPVYWIIIGGGFIVLLAAFLLWRRSQQEQFSEDDEFDSESEQEATNNLTDLDSLSSGGQTVAKNSGNDTLNDTNAALTSAAPKFADAKKTKDAVKSSANPNDTKVIADVGYEADGVSDAFTDTDTTEEAADILGEADIYIAYGRFDQAEEVLVKAIKRDKSRPEFYLKLIEVYAEKNDTVRFNRTVKQLDDQGFSANFSHRITELRSILNAAASNNNTKEEVLDTLPELMASEKGPLDSVSNMEFEDENLVLQPVFSNNTEDAMSLLDDLESNIIGTVPESDGVTDAAMMDFDADEEPSVRFALDESFDSVKPKPSYAPSHSDEIISPKLQHEGLGDQSLLTNPLTLDEPSFDLDIESLAADLDDDLNQMSADRALINVADITEATADEVIGDEDEVATKLDLARAYIDMGDREGAKDILDEVMSDGSPQQQQEARSLRKKVG